MTSPVVRHAIAVLAVALFAAATGLAGVFSLPPLDRDEARFAQATAQMLESGDFIAIRFQDSERNKKPAGIHWLQAASVTAFSDVSAREIWAYRIPSLAGVILAAAFTCLAGARLYGPRTGLLAGLLLAAAPVVAAEATIAKTDAVLLALVCMAQLAFIHVYARAQAAAEAGWRWPLSFWAAQGAAALVKGPIGPMISILTGLGLALKPPRWSWLAPLRPASGVLLLILIVSPWAFAIWAATEGRFFADAVGGDMLGKVGDAQEGHVGPPGYHAALVWLLFWPAAALIAPGLILAWRERADWRARFLLAWVVPAWIVFELAATKLPHYVMPLYPALAIMAAHAATQMGAKAAASVWVRRSGALVYLGAGLAAAALAGALPILAGEAQTSPLHVAAASLTAAGAILIAILFWRSRAFTGGVAAALLASAYAWTMMGAALPGLSPLAVSPRLSAALDIVELHPLHDDLAPAAIAGYSEPSAVFLLGTQTALTTGADAAARLISGAASAAIVETREDAAFKTALGGVSVASLAVIDGLNYSNGKTVTLTIYTIAP